MTAPAVGQIWKDVDPRHERFIRIETDATSTNTIGIRTVVQSGDGWVPSRGSRAGYANLARFNGKRGGYEFIAQAERQT